MPKSSDDKKRDEALKRALQMKPQKHGSKIDKPSKKLRKTIDAKAQSTQKNGRGRSAKKNPDRLR